MLVEYRRCRRWAPDFQIFVDAEGAFRWQGTVGGRVTYGGEFFVDRTDPLWDYPSRQLARLSDMVVRAERDLELADPFSQDLKRACEYLEREEFERKNRS